ncbi:DUF4961 domain-containing protein [Sphingobacterium sp. DR205]|uniref:DUF4961 domain-containing protein n=1 Tax=Sphingobacterium sp. DR205 TaxID=2713573 RepID=UPI0013E48C0E|nr:DUF4961 domain-containing protein [Sphingobacterium sp. DR205]QIH35419.1 DUF4961 domain-containing protein [Sphingobacterium sp. DR205]
MKKNTHYSTYIYWAMGLFLAIFLVQCGLKAISVVVPTAAKANQRVTFTMHCGAEPRIQGGGNYSTQLVAGIMVPKGWNARKNLTMSFTSPKGNGTMRIIPDSELEPVSGLSWHQAAKKMFGIGPNLVDDMEWIVFRSTQAYSFVNNEDIDFTVKAECNVGSENMLVSLGFYIGSSIENLRPEDTDYKKFTFSNAFEVTDGEGDLIDFINPQLGTVQPVKSLDNDIITLTFDGGVTNTVLDQEPAIYLHVRAMDESGKLIAEIKKQTADTKLTDIGGKKYLIDIWPRGFFKVDKDRHIARLEYFYTDITGTKSVGYGNTDEPFKYTFRCE